MRRPSRQRARDELVALAESRKDVPLPELASVKDIIVDGAAGPIAARLYATGRTPAPTIVYFHGGGWVAGDLFTHERQARTLALEADAVVVSVDYRRPPETPFPGASRMPGRDQMGGGERGQLGGDPARLAVAVTAPAATSPPPSHRPAGRAGRGSRAHLIYPATDLLGHYGVAAENAKYPSRQETPKATS